ncbi:aldo/keto reductase [Shimia abyssi]|uniref:Aryl-alcohol dehydrogenase-like predicted oxidoreductase n=1 Tax=Shimia abyssi TaxID=1662395 RepID=A0A2P8FDN8_9RHOB|nr:aldo/keto reductase [Shimia abyssi]PSL19788.1 aryl-alcohol dehydrogenase-like predicted oxidoreductase [Shimia abyssi]
MKLRKFSNGPDVSAVGVGAMSFSDFYGPTDEARSHAILDAAMDVGVTHLDTANVYGMGTSEQRIGTYLAARGKGARDRFFIASKAAITKDDAGKRCIRNDLAHLEAELDQSLVRMGIDCVDLFYVHRRDPEMPIEDVAGALGELVRRGKTKHIGFSEIAPSSLRRAHGEFPVSAVQSEYSLSVRAPELGLVQTCAELNVALVAFSPVGRSLLTDNPLSYERILEIPFMRNNPRFMGSNFDFNIKESDKFRALAADMGLPAAALAIAWVLAQGEHVFAIPGTRSVTHFNELVRGAEITLSDSDLATIEAVLPVGWAHGDRYDVVQWVGPERFS